MLPCGVDLERFRAMPRAQARERLGLDPDRPYLLFPADPARAEKRHDRAAELADATGVRLLTLGRIDPADVPTWVNAANAVLVPSEREGSAWRRWRRWPATCRCWPRPSASPRWRSPASRGRCARSSTRRAGARAHAHLEAADPRVEGRDRAALFSSARMAERVAAAWRGLVAGE